MRLWPALPSYSYLASGTNHIAGSLRHTLLLDVNRLQNHERALNALNRGLSRRFASVKFIVSRSLDYSNKIIEGELI